MSHYTMLYKYGKRTREFLFLFYFRGVSNKIIITLSLLDMKWLQPSRRYVDYLPGVAKLRIADRRTYRYI